MQGLKKRFTLSALIFMACGLPALAADASAADKSNNLNVTLYTLVGLMLILLFVIGMLGYTLRLLTTMAGEKLRSRKVNGKAALLLALAFIIPSMSFAEQAAAPAVPFMSAVDGIPAFDFYLLTGVIALELIIVFFLSFYINFLMKIIKGAPEKEPETEKEVKKSWFWDKFNAAATIEQERDILLDHNYDGIQELDNSLPPWWKYGFYLTIVVSFIYIYRFHISHDGQSQKEEYVAEMQQGEDDKAAYLAKSANNVDESNVVQLTEGDAIAAGEELFAKNCVACHLADGGGSVGPNLTDDYWLHGGDIKNIFKTIKYGWQDKGMKSWKDDFSPMQIQQLSSFVRTLHGTHPAVPKAPQGDLYMELKADTATGKVDTAAKSK
ncbi:MAG: c-type cytochrome [Taibaiella sp.]|nr:c-type cytochrome [Taibaiella sp.]